MGSTGVGGSRDPLIFFVFSLELIYKLVRESYNITILNYTYQLTISRRKSK